MIENIFSSILKIIAVLFLLLSTEVNIHAQGSPQRPFQSGNSGSSGSGNSSSSIVDLEYNGPDTSFFRFFTLENRADFLPAVDTSLYGFENYADEKQFDHPALNLGNLGSSAFPLLYSINTDISNNFRYNQYDIYHQSVNNFRFYDLNTPYNDLFFSPVSGQQNFLVKAKFSRNFKNNLNIALDYKRINQAGFYTNQDTKITSFGIGIWSHSDNKKRNSFIRLIATNNNEAHNGGVINGGVDDLDLFGRDFNSSRLNIPVYLSDASSRLERFQYLFDNFFKASNFIFHHNFSYEHGFYKYFDEQTNTDLIRNYYGQYAIEDRGIRSYNGFKHLSNTFSIAFDVQKFRIRTGTEYAFRSFDQESDPFTRSDWFLFGDINTDFGLIAFNGFIKTGLLDAAGNLLLQSRLQLPLSDWIQLGGNFTLSRYNAGLQTNSLVLNTITIDNFANEWDKITESQLGLSIEIPNTKTKLSWTAFTSDNLVYLNSDTSFVQNTSTVLGSRLSAEQKLSWKFIEFNNGVHIQNFDNNIQNLPTLYSRHELLLNFRLFKKRLKTQLGAVAIFTRHEGDVKYFPLLASFYPASSDDERITFYPYGEVFANFKIDDFRVFVKAENIMDYYFDEIYYQVQEYPQFDFKIRLGVGWFLRN